MHVQSLLPGFREPEEEIGHIVLGTHSVIMSGFAREQAPALLEEMNTIAAIFPFRHMVTRSGWRMSIACTNCGDVGWVSDRTGYRYDRIDPATGRPWPRMPRLYTEIAGEAAETAGYGKFEPDACLINRYEPGNRLSLHQDRNERNFDHPVVSVSLGLPVIFLWGGPKREERPTRARLAHGDVMVWGGPDRLMFHGVRELANGIHPLVGPIRCSLTFRKAL
jgi:alkylated DNA repair protein (DNA oxidative demethylase)